MRGKGDIAGLARRSGKSIKLSLAAFSLLVLLISFVVPLGLGVIKSEMRFVSVSVWIGMSVVMFLERHHAMHAQIFVTKNKVPFLLSSFVTGAVYLALLGCLLPRIGIWGVVCAQGISNLIINNWWIVKISLESLGDWRRENLAGYLIPSVALFSLSLVLMPLAQKLSQTAIGWIGENEFSKKIRAHH